MTVHHINSNGDVKPCKATKNRCQFGDESLHFTSTDSAKDFVASVKVAGNDHLLRGKKTSSSKLLRSTTTLTPVTRPRIASIPTIPVAGAVAASRWETSGVFRLKVSFVCGACAQFNNRHETHVVATDKRYIAGICVRCTKRNLFTIGTSARRGTGWLVKYDD